MNAGRPVDVQRVRHVPRELLRSQDLRIQQEAGDQRRWWHNRALHDVLGVAEGLDVTLTEDRSAAVVAPGVGYDCFGHELLVAASRIVPLPAGQESTTLMACFRGSGAEATLRWRPAGNGGRCCTPLAELAYDDGSPVVTAAGQRARPLARPRIGHGATPADGTPWQPWTVADPDSARTWSLGLQVRIETGAAGFTAVPCYFAWLLWPRVADSRLPEPTYHLLSLQYVEEPAIDRFVFRVVLPTVFLRFRAGAVRPARRAEEPRPDDLALSLARAQRLAVCWLGVQHEPRSTRRRAR